MNSPSILGEKGTLGGGLVWADSPLIEGIEGGTTTWAAKERSAETFHALPRASVGMHEGLGPWGPAGGARTLEAGRRGRTTALLHRLSLRTYGKDGEWGRRLGEASFTSVPGRMNGHTVERAQSQAWPFPLRYKSLKPLRKDSIAYTQWTQVKIHCTGRRVNTFFSRVLYP